MSGERKLQGGVGRWLEDRTSVVSSFRREYIDFAMPANLSWLWAFGAFAMITVGLMVLSGLFLAINYTADIANAFRSVETIDRAVAFGWLIRSIHMAGASLLFAVLYIHFGRGLYYGSYKAPREIVWLSGLAMFVMVMVTAFAGYVLPWGQMSYWGATVIVNAVGAIPVIGRGLAEAVFGEMPLGDVTLHRVFVLHFVAAFGLLAMIGLHVAAVHAAGPNNPTGVSLPRKRTLPFHPYYTSKDGLGICIFLLVFAVLVFFLPGMLTLSDNYLEATPLATPGEIAPEWYFAPFFAILKALPSRLAGLVCAAGSLLVLFAVPWLDRGVIRSARYRPVIRFSTIAAFLAFILLGVAGTHPATSGWLWLARVCLVVWFGHFLFVLPVASRRDDLTRVPAEPSGEDA